MNTLRFTGTCLAACLGVSTYVATSASAHVRVSPETAAVGSYPTLTFRVPNESDTASTTKLEVDLPTDHPFSYVAYRPMPGWSAKVTTTKLTKPLTTGHGTITEAPTKIVWTADAASAVRPGQFQDFLISAGAVPDTGKLSFAARQTYSDGKVVSWAQPMTGTTEPENPAPVLYVKDKAPGSSATPAASSAAASSTDQKDSDDSTARWLSLGALGVALAGLLVAVRSLTRRPTA